MHHETTLPPATDRGRNWRIVRSKGKLFRESRGIGEDLVAIGRERSAGWHLVAAWAAPHDGAARRGNSGGFAAPGRFVLGILRLRDIAEFRGIDDRTGVERR